MRVLILIAVVSIMLPLAAVGQTQAQREAQTRAQEQLLRFALTQLLQDSMRSTEYGQTMLDPKAGTFSFHLYSDEALAIVADFRKTLSEKDAGTRKTQQQALIDRLQTVPIIKATILEKQAPKPDGAGQAEKARKPIEELAIDESRLFSENIEEMVPRYSIPAELSTEEAQTLILDVQLLEEYLKRFPVKLSEYRRRLAYSINPDVQAKLWERLTTKQGFKDANIGKDWYVLAAEHSSLIGAVETLLGTTAELTGIAIASMRLSGIKMRLIGSRVTLGDRAFVKGALEWLKAREGHIEANLAQLIVLETRLQTEGVLSRP